MRASVSIEPYPAALRLYRKDLRSAGGAADTGAEQPGEGFDRRLRPPAMERPGKRPRAKALG
ncbi:hypothetical protein GCM10009102_28200 [Sphingomonas insulae]|uniref:Uncharacterized protein n=1 Tax=Sphingomonas insulae TaxID=424800 RepID=A0ABN1HZ30_9SPHN